MYNNHTLSFTGDAPTEIHCLGYQVFVPPQPHPFLGGLALMHSAEWHVQSHTYITAHADNSERLLLMTFGWTHTFPWPSSIPPSSSLLQFRSFFTALFTDISEFQKTYFALHLFSSLMRILITSLDTTIITSTGFQTDLSHIDATPNRKLSPLKGNAAQFLSNSHGKMNS